MIPILRVRDDEGNYVNIPAIKGDKGDPGDTGVIDTATETTLTGILKGAGGHVAAAVAGTDYLKMESGTWNPIPAYTNITITNVNKATYLKIGKLVWVTLDVHINARSTGDYMEFAGLPYYPSGMSMGKVDVFHASPTWGMEIPQSLSATAYGEKGTDVPDTKNISIIYRTSDGENVLLRDDDVITGSSGTTVPADVALTLIYETDE